MDKIDILKLATKTVDQFYNLDEDQRSFLLSISSNDRDNWSRYDLMKALMLYNRAKELDCGLGHMMLDEFVEIIDKKSNQLNHTLKIVDDNYRKEIGVI